MPKWLRERREAPKADDTALLLASLPNGFQGVEDLKTSLATTPIVGTEVKTCVAIVVHVEADLENTPRPPTWCAKCRWVLCRKNTGYHAKDPKVSNTAGYTHEI
jgi:hypothetical protein